MEKSCPAWKKLPGVFHLVPSFLVYCTAAARCKSALLALERRRAVHSVLANSEEERNHSLRSLVICCQGWKEFGAALEWNTNV